MKYVIFKCKIRMAYIVDHPHPSRLEKNQTGYSALGFWCLDNPLPYLATWHNFIRGILQGFLARRSSILPKAFLCVVRRGSNFHLENLTRSLCIKPDVKKETYLIYRCVLPHLNSLHTWVDLFCANKIIACERNKLFRVHEMIACERNDFVQTKWFRAHEIKYFERTK